MSASDGEVAGALADAFDRACRRAAPVCAHVRIAGRPVTFRIAEKQCLFPIELAHGRARESVDVVAVVLLRAGSRRTELAPAKRSAVLMSVARNAMWTVVPRPGAAAMGAIARLAEDVPGYWLQLGADPHDTPTVIEQLLGSLAVR